MLGTSIHNVTAIRLGSIYVLDKDIDSYARKIFIYSKDIPMDSFQIMLFGTYEELSHITDARKAMSSDYDLLPGAYKKDG